jgi:ABC-type glycerol-3-phosphate transport system substrate-binding protein
MKRLALMAVVLALAFCGCQNPSSNPVAGVGGTFTSQPDGTWTAGVTITFKTLPPDNVRATLVAAGATTDHAGLVYVLPNNRAKDLANQRAVLAAMRVPGTVITSK